MVTNRVKTALLRWFDASIAEQVDSDDRAIDWLRTLPFIAMHLACLGIFFVGAVVIRGLLPQEA